MNEQLTQALIRTAIAFVAAGIAAIIPLLTIFTTVVPADQVPMVTIVVAGLTAVLNGVLKYIGGPTTQPPASPEGFRQLGEGKRPNVLAL